MGIKFLIQENDLAGGGWHGISLDPGPMIFSMLQHPGLVLLIFWGIQRGGRDRPEVGVGKFACCIKEGMLTMR